VTIFFPEIVELDRKDLKRKKNYFVLLRSFFNVFLCLVKINIVEPRFSVRFWRKGKIYTISKCPLYQGFIHKSNI